MIQSLKKQKIFTFEGGTTLYPLALGLRFSPFSLHSLRTVL